MNPLRLTVIVAALLGVLCWALLIAVDPLRPPVGRRFSDMWE